VAIAAEVVVVMARRMITSAATMKAIRKTRRLSNPSHIPLPISLAKLMSSTHPLKRFLTTIKRTWLTIGSSKLANEEDRLLSLLLWEF
jgi:hypothetical protein